jgi:hypothetical protein
MIRMSLFVTQSTTSLVLFYDASIHYRTSIIDAQHEAKGADLQGDHTYSLCYDRRSTYLRQCYISHD